jgi:hypothetical protein
MYIYVYIYIYKYIYIFIYTYIHTHTHTHTYIHTYTYIYVYIIYIYIYIHTYPKNIYPKYTSARCAVAAVPYPFVYTKLYLLYLSYVFYITCFYLYYLHCLCYSNTHLQKQMKKKKHHARHRAKTELGGSDRATLLVRAYASAFLLSLLALLVQKC